MVGKLHDLHSGEAGIAEPGAVGHRNHSFTSPCFLVSILNFPRAGPFTAILFIRMSVNDHLGEALVAVALGNDSEWGDLSFARKQCIFK